jgi:glycosyltransferase involved in cell wall biosynthesis
LFSKKKNVKFIATFHKPPETLNRLISNKKYVKKLDAAIVVGSNQLDYIKKSFEIKNVFYIPHGIDTAFFKPSYNLRPTDKKVILFVGQHLRDFSVFNTTVELLLQENENYIVNVVLRKEYASKVLKHSRITVYSGISDIDLCWHYQSSHLLFLPFIDVTACNSLLEGLACGLPIVTTNIGGNNKYLEGTSNLLVNKDSSLEIYIEAIKSLIEQDKDLSISKTSRNKSLEYNWEAISDTIYKHYMNL